MIGSLYASTTQSLSTSVSTGGYLKVDPAVDPADPGPAPGGEGATKPKVTLTQAQIQAAVLQDCEDKALRSALSVHEKFVNEHKKSGEGHTCCYIQAVCCCIVGVVLIVLNAGDGDVDADLLIFLGSGLLTMGVVLFSCAFYDSYKGGWKLNAPTQMYDIDEKSQKEGWITQLLEKKKNGDELLITPRGASVGALPDPSVGGIT